MEAWSTTAFDETSQADLFAASPVAGGRPPVVRCWLAFDRGGDDVGVALTLSDRRHLIADASTGYAIVGDDDLVLLPDRSRDELICLGPPWLLPALPTGFRARGLAHWSKLLRDTSLATFRPSPEANACIAFDIRPGPPLGWSALHGDLRDGTVGRHPDRPAPDGVAFRGARDARLVDGLLHFERGRQLAEAGNGSEARLERAKRHLRRAAQHFAAGRQLGWGEVAERYLSRLESQLFRMRQMDLPALLPPRQADALCLPRLGLGVHRLMAVPLPPLALTRGAVPAAAGRGARERREALCFVPLHRPTLRRLLPGTRPDALRGQVVFGPPGAGTATTAVRLGKGGSVAVSAILDGEVHQLLGIASRERAAETVTVFADGNGVVVSPGVKQGRVGHPLTFKATAREGGKHALRFTFLTRDRIVSKIQRTVEVYEDNGQDGSSAWRSPKAG